jgi:cysteinyl-tRNA synthetase
MAAAAAVLAVAAAKTQNKGKKRAHRGNTRRTIMKIFNTLSRRKEEFVPLEPGKVKMYVCGPTVYNFIHIGNARPMIIFDTVRRYFEYKGYDVNYVSNFTDVDDKIIKKAIEEGVDAETISKRYIAECKKDMADMNVKPATTHPQATQEIQGMLEMIQTLIDKGHAYVAADGTVYFRTKSFKGYGKLSHKNLDEMMSGFRELKVTGEENKEDPSDFVLWKPKKDGEPYWESPWCQGRPGWHIECSVMSKKYLGEQIDIHAGGEDLIFPHHENEIAQSEAANDKTFANYWMHNGFLNIDNKKMSKSLGNFFTVREIGEKYDLQVLRFFMLSAHYRSPINFSAELMEASKNGLERIITCAERLKELLNKVSGDALTEAEQENKKIVDELVAKFEAAMDDDFNTADAVSAIFELVKLANSTANEESSKAYVELLAGTIAKLSDVLGIITERKAEVLDSEVEELIAARQQARKEKNFALADEIRQKLLDMGIVLEDTREGVKWKRA